jgi:hypothetical protein
MAQICLSTTAFNQLCQLQNHDHPLSIHASKPNLDREPILTVIAIWSQQVATSDVMPAIMFLSACNVKTIRLLKFGNCGVLSLLISFIGDIPRDAILSPTFGSR